jgi:uncharacterized membrane protein
MVAATMTASRSSGLQTQATQAKAPMNVADVERIASMFGGGALALFGLSQRSLPGIGLALLGTALLQRGYSGQCQLYRALNFSTAQPRGPATSVPAGEGVKLQKTVTVNRSPGEIYRFWRFFTNLPRFMSHLESVTSQGNRSHWVAKGPMGMRFEWDAEVINDRPNELIAWRSLPGSTVDTAGSVHFLPTFGGGTEVQVTLKYNPPGGKIGASLAGLFGQAPEQQIEDDLHRFKQLMEGSSTAVRV